MNARIKILLKAIIPMDYCSALIFIILCTINSPIYANRIDPELSTAMETINTLWEMDSLDKAVSQLNLTAPKFVKKYGKLSIEYCDFLTLSSKIYYDYGDYKKSRTIVNESLNIRNQIGDTLSTNYALDIATKASCVNGLGNKPESLSLLHNSLNIFNRLGYNSPEYAETLKEIGALYYSMGNNSLSLEFLGRAVNMIHNVGLDDTHYLVVNIEISNAVIQGDCGDIKFAIEELLRVHKKLNRCKCNNMVHVLTLEYLSGFYRDKEDYINCIKYGSEALELLKITAGVDHTFAEDIYKFIGDGYRGINDFDNAKKYYQLALRNCEKSLGYNNPSTVTLLERILSITPLDNMDECEKIVSSICSRRNNYMFNAMAKLDNGLQRIYWNKKHNSWYQNTLPLLCYRSNSNILNEQLYNGVLLSKGIFLQSDIKFLQELRRNPDQSFLHRYVDLSSKRKHNISPQLRDSINNVEQMLRAELYKQTDYLSSLKVTWQNIKSQLNNDEAAIEFLSFPLESGKIQYAALIIKETLEFPTLIHLFSEDDLNTIPSDSYYENTSLSQLLWDPIAEYLMDIDVIYFSPAGELYNIAIENLPVPNNKNEYMSDKYKFYRVGSTRSIVDEDTPNFILSAVLFGDMNYNFNLPDVKIDANWNNIADSLNLRGGHFGPLPATRLEINNAEKELSTININITRFDKNLATKKSFCNLSGSSPSIIHIATHGFYNKDSSINNGQQDAALSNSGLLFAGANSSIEQNNGAKNNGILTAEEISKLDLLDVDLVVLSACQTGLGEIKGDGIYGLQRGFKMAGAHSLLMSLWKVDDDATQILMSEFYKCYVSGLTKQESLQRAQRVVRDTPGFNDPEYWAAFILLDGLN